MTYFHTLRSFWGNTLFHMSTAVPREFHFFFNDRVTVSDSEEKTLQPAKTKQDKQEHTVHAFKSSEVLD